MDLGSASGQAMLVKMVKVEYGSAIDFAGSDHRFFSQQPRGGEAGSVELAPCWLMHVSGWEVDINWVTGQLGLMGQMALCL